MNYKVSRITQVIDFQCFYVVSCIFQSQINGFGINQVVLNGI